MAIEATFKVKVFVNHKQIGWLRSIAVKNEGTRSGPDFMTEHVISASLAKGSRYTCSAAGEAMADFRGPDRESDKKSLPVVTFQLCLN